MLGQHPTTKRQHPEKIQAPSTKIQDMNLRLCSTLYLGEGNHQAQR